MVVRGGIAIAPIPIESSMVPRQRKLNVRKNTPEGTTVRGKGRIMCIYSSIVQNDPDLGGRIVRLRTLHVPETACHVVRVEVVAGWYPE